jgi:hypothetical protein
MSVQPATEERMQAGAGPQTREVKSSLSTTRSSSVPAAGLADCHWKWPFPSTTPAGFGRAEHAGQTMLDGCDCDGTVKVLGVPRAGRTYRDHGDSVAAETAPVPRNSRAVSRQVPLGPVLRFPFGDRREGGSV